MVSASTLLPDRSAYCDQGNLVRAPPHSACLPLALEGPRPHCLPFPLVRHGHRWPCWGTSTKDSGALKIAEHWCGLLTLFTQGCPDHSEATQMQELIGPGHPFTHSKGDTAPEGSHRDHTGVPEAPCCTNKCLAIAACHLSSNAAWTPILDHSKQEQSIENESPWPYNLSRGSGENAAAWPTGAAVWGQMAEVAVAHSNNQE